MAVEVAIAGATYAPGAELTFEGGRYTVVGVGAFEASKASGLSAGRYPVVFETVAGRRAYRAYVDGALYPIRQYGSADAVIAKQRASKTRRAAPEVSDVDADDLDLSAEASRLLSEYAALNPGPSQSETLSQLVVKHLGPEVERLKRARQAIQQLPLDLLARLADATAEKRAEVLELLR